MPPLWHKFLAVLLTVIFTGAAHACLCLGMDDPARSVASAAAVPSSDHADSHACCKDASAGDHDIPTGVPNAPAGNGDEDPCGDCNLRYAQVSTVPETAPSTLTPHLHVAVASPIDADLLLTLVARPAYRVTDDVPIPPLLRDLHHSFCLLTV